MSTLRVKVNGEWVDTEITGSVRIGDTTIEFGPEAGPTYESLAWPEEPSGTNFTDGTLTYNMGIQFQLTNAKNCLGVRWRVPDSVETPNGQSHSVSLWNGTTRVVSKNFVPAPGTYQDVFFDSPIALGSGITYIVTVFTQHYVFRSGDALPVSSPSGNVVADGGRLVEAAAAVEYPSGTYNALYYVSPIVEV